MQTAYGQILHKYRSVKCRTLNAGVSLTCPSTLTACADDGGHLTRHRLGQLSTQSLNPLHDLPVHVPGHGERQLGERRGVLLGLHLLLLHAGRGLAQVLQQSFTQLTLVAGAGDGV